MPSKYVRKYQDDSWKNARPQNRNLVSQADRPPEERRAIAKKGGEAYARKLKQKQDMKQLIELIGDRPIIDGRVRNRLKRMGIPEDEFTQKLLVADALIKAAQNGNTQAIDRYLELTGEKGGGGGRKENNLLIALEIGVKNEEIDISDIPEIQPAPESGDDVVGEETV